MEIKVFDIKDEIIEEKLEEIDVLNIKKVFTKIFSSQNTGHLKSSCKANEESILNEYNAGKKEFNLFKFAEHLKEAESKGDGSRNKQITEGYLFIRKEEEKLSLLKLENIEVVDKEKNYEMKTSFSTESNYYKGCIVQSDLNDITVVDRNKSIAKYWRERFLELSLNRDEYQNSIELIDLFKKNNLYSDVVRDSENYQNIHEETESYIFQSNIFDKVDLANRMRSKSLISELELNEIYSDSSKALDAEFGISQKAIKENYKKTINISKDTKIYTDNYAKLFKRQGIEYRDGKIILSVENEYINEIPEELKDGN